MISAVMLHDFPVKLWDLGSNQRLRRQIGEMGGVEWLDNIEDLPAGGRFI